MGQQGFFTALALLAYGICLIPSNVPLKYRNGMLSSEMELDNKKPAVPKGKRVNEPI
jgi:hypothetical protein